MIKKLTEHIKETDKCCFCGKVYHNYGYSTWGYWTAEEEKANYGENKRCCAECNASKINPARLKKAAAIEAGKIKNVLEDIK